jgi:hypothetical protein
MLWRPLSLMECFLEAKHAWCMKKTHNKQRNTQKWWLEKRKKKGRVQVSK